MAFAAKETELQEVRYAKALIAFNNKNYERSLKFLDQNLNFKYPHIESIELLASIHEQRKDYKKAIRVYYYLIKRSGGKKFIKAIKGDDYEDKVDKLPKPTQKQLSYFFKLGNMYINYHDKMKGTFKQLEKLEEINKKKKKRKIKVKLKENNKTKFVLVTVEEKRKLYLYQTLKTAEKYLLLCKRENFSKALTTFLLGLIENKRNNNYKANRLFKKAYAENFTDEDEAKNNKDQSLKELLEYYIGDSLYKSGHKELATRYFKSLATNTNSSSLKSFSKLYIDSLTSSYTSFYAMAGAGIDTNPLSQDPSTLTNSTFNESDCFTNYELGIFVNRNSKDNKRSLVINTTLSGFEFQNEDYKIGDQQTWIISGEAKFLNMPKSIKKIKVTNTTVKTKQDDSDALSTFSTSNEFELSYDRYLSTGILSFAAPVTISSISTSAGTAETTQYLAEITYTPWGISKYFSPSFSFSYGPTTTNGITSELDSMIFSMTNQFSLTSKNTLYTTLRVQNDTAVDPDSNNFLLSLQVISLYDLGHWAKDLIFQTQIDSTYNEIGEENDSDEDSGVFYVIKRHKISFNLKYSF